MSYADELTQLLLPLGVYSFRAGSFSLGALQALGAKLDEALAWEQAGQRETLLPTAGTEGVEKLETLFRYKAPVTALEDRKKAVAAFLLIGGDGFTLEALQKCVSACGVSCKVEETESSGAVRVSFPGIMGVPEGYKQMRVIIEDILPCHLDIRYFFRYCTWAETELYGLKWQDLAQMSWYGWSVYVEN